VPILDDLKSFDVDAATTSLWVFKSPRGPSNAPPIYSGHWVETTEGVDTALKETVKDQRARIEETIEYGLLAQNNEASALLIAKEETNGGPLVDAAAAETENRRVLRAERLQNTAFYLIKMVHNNDVLFAIRRTDSGWKTKRAMSARSIFFADNMLDLDNRPHFDLEKTIDFFIFAETILILNKGHFESILRYKEANLGDFRELQDEPEFANIFVDLNPLVQHVGVNKIQLRRMSAVRQKAYYRNSEFMNRLRQRHGEYGFTFQFDADGRIVATPETSSQIITALLDHRLRSGFSDQTYDVQDATPVTV
jgi:hypothetical protein